MSLSFELTGAIGSGQRVAFLHGFTQTGRSWLPVTDGLPSFESMLIDAPGHGGSAEVKADLPAGADLVAATMKRGTLVGYSMGARFALHTVLRAPDTVDSLVLVSGTPGIEDETERAARRRADDALADRIESIPLADFLDEWLANPMFDGLDHESRNMADRLRNTPAGLASSLRLAGTGTQQPLWDRLDAIKCPVLIVCGSRDPKFVDIARRMKDRIASSEIVEIEDSGHTVHLEQTARFTVLLTEWLSARQ